MALKINGTTVINDSRGLENISNLKTINGQSIVGSGDLAVTGSSTFASDLTVSGIRVGVGANAALWTNCVMGRDAMGKVTNGQDNAVVGRNAMQENTTGYANVAIGSYALNLNNTGYYNSAVGMSSLQQNTTGWSNVAFGLSASYSNTEGYLNTAIGFRALHNNRTGYRNTAIGEQALYSYINATGYNNTAIGSNAMRDCTDGNHNIGIGDYALGNNRADYNLAIGGQALMFNRNGASNIAIGDRALRLNNGNNNVAIGTSALSIATTSYGISNSSIQILNAGSGYTNGTHTNINVIVKSSPTDVKINQEPIVTVTVVNGQITNIQNDSGFNGLGGPLDIDTIYSIRNGTMGANGSGFEFKFTQMAKAQNNVAIGTMAGSGLRLGSGNIIIGSMNNNGSYVPIYDCVGSDSNRVAMGHKSVTNAYIQVPWTVVSDARDKTNFASIPHGLEFVKQLKPTSFQFKVSRDSDKTNGGVRYGFKAQDIALIEPEGVIVDTTDPEKFYYNESNLVPVLVKAIQELTAEVERLKAKVE